ncbi:MAG: flagellar hook capping FlgD N-terminal domain-containing protein [bacterium]
MTAPSPVTAPTSVGAGDPSARTTVSGDAFVQLLVAEVSHEDPTNATDPSTMVTQLAQMSSVNELVQTRQMEQTQVAMALVGHSVTVTDPSTGNPVSGSVTGVTLGVDGPSLVINGQAIPFANLQSVP